MIQIKENDIGSTCNTNWEKGNAYRISVGKPEGKRQLGRPRYRWVDNIKMDLRDIGCDVMNRIDVAENRDQWKALVNTVIFGNF
jgi:hypothetical protein